MKWYIKVLIGLGSLLVIGTLGFMVFKQIEISDRQKAIETQVVEQKQLVDGIVRSQSSWTTREDMEKFIKDNNVNLDAIKEDLAKLDAEVAAVNLIVAVSQGQHGTHIPTTPGPGTNPNPVDPKNPDPYGYMQRQQTLALEENFGSVRIPIGVVGFSGWQERPWNVDIAGREYHVTTVEGRDENNRAYFYNKFTVKVDGKEYIVPITSAITKQVFPEAKWHWWNPKVFLTAGGGINVTELPVNGTFNAGATFGFMSWGRYRSNPDISVGQVGIGYSSNDNEFAVIVNPVAFNIGNAIGTEVLANTYVGPSLQITHTGKVFTGVNVSIGF